VHDTARHAGIALGVAVLGALIPSGALGTAHGAATYVDGLHRACWVATAVAALGALAAWRLVRPQRQSEPDISDVPQLSQPVLLLTV
jgi:hypothetical protein